MYRQISGVRVTDGVFLISMNFFGQHTFDIKCVNKLIFFIEIC